MKKGRPKSIWVFGDYRNYFQNRVTLQLLSRATDLAGPLGAEVCAVVFGSGVEAYVEEYVAHGAATVLVVDHPDLQNYSVELYAALAERLAKSHRPEIILVGATRFGREFAPRVAKRLGTGLTADCIGLDLDPEGNLLQTAPSFGGNLLAKIVTPSRRPQMATVRPGIFREIPHDPQRRGEILREPLPADLPGNRLRLVGYERQPHRTQRLEDARVVVVGGRGMGSKSKFRKLFDLARLMGAEVGATRPVIYSQWVEPEALVGQAGKHVRPQVLFSFGVSGAIQHTAAIMESGFIIAVNKNPTAPMMKMADVAIVADANQFCTALIRDLKSRIRA
jgi:electron transfer flavoprotein alpha subunit